MDEAGQLDRGGPFKQFLYYFSALCLIGITAVIGYATVARYFFNAPPFWGEEIAVLLFVWMGFGSAGLAIVSGWNVRVDAVLRMLPLGLAHPLELAMHVIVVGFLATLLYHSGDVVELSLYGKLEATRWPSVVMTACLPAGLAVMLFYQSVLLVRAFRRWRRPAATGAA